MGTWISKENCIWTFWSKTRASYKEFGHSHWWELIEIFVPKFGIWFSSLFPEWELIPTGIPTGGNWLKYLIPNLGFDSPAYSQSGNWFPQEFPLVGIDWNICSQIQGTFKSQLHVQIHFVLCNPSAFESIEITKIQIWGCMMS